MERKWVEKQFEDMGSRVTIRKGTAPIRINRGLGSNRGTLMRLNVAKDKKGEHFTFTIDPEVDEKNIIFQVLDRDDKLRQMLLMLKYEDSVEKLLVGHDESHWFVAGVSGSKSIKEAFANLRPAAANLSIQKSGVKDKDWRKRRNKGFVRQGEWFFVPVHFTESKSTIIHKNEPIRRPSGGTAHIVEEVVRSGGETVYVYGNEILNPEEFSKVKSDRKYLYSQRKLGSRVLGRGKVKHPDHHTIELKTWHEVHLSNETVGGIMSANAFLD